MAHTLCHGHQIPKGMPVATFALVGAFRTGKSFMLDLILKYLRYHDNLAKGEGAAAAGSDTPGAVNAVLCLYLMVHHWFTFCVL